MFRGLARSRDETLSAIAQKAVKEVAYHAHLANEWVTRLGDGTGESRARMIAGLEWCGVSPASCLKLMQSSKL